MGDGSGPTPGTAGKTLLIGLAGKTGAGKNFVAGLLEERGWRTLDLDEVAHRALDALAAEIDAALGPGLLKDGKIDRKQLGRIVFAQTAALTALEEITYPWIEKTTWEWIDEEPGKPAAIHAINLHKTSLPEKMRAILWISAPKRIRKRRVMERDGRDWKELKGRFLAQKGVDPKLFAFRAETFNVRNSGNRAAVERRLDRILGRIRSGEPRTDR